MNQSYKLFTAATLILLTLSGCAEKPKEVASLSDNVQKQVDQNLQNSRLPTVQEVEQGSVPAAADECQTFKATIPSDYFQDQIEVPEDISKPDGQKTKIFYYGRLAKDTPPVLFYNGGPGSPSHNSFRAITRAQSFFDPDKKLGFVFIDQRGTGCSDFYPQGDSPEILNRLINYGSSGIVSDSEFIRRKIVGDKKIIAFGQSFGAFVAHRYATLYPQSLKAAFAHANTINSDGDERVINRLASQARVNDFYFKQFPDDQDRLKKLREYLVADKCFVSKDDPKMKNCGFEVLDSIPSSLLGFTDQWITIHGWIGKMVTDSGVSDDGIAEFLATFSFTKNNPLNSKRWATKVIDLSDRNVPSMDAAFCTKANSALQQKGINLEEIAFNECASTLQQKYKPIDLSKLANIQTHFLTIADFVSALKTNSVLNFYVYSGQKDPYVPVENFAEEVAAAKDLPNFHYFNFIGTGHDGFKTEPKVWQELLQEATK